MSTTTVAVRVSEDLARRLRALANGRPVSEVLREMVIAGVEKAEDRAAEERRAFLEQIQAENAYWRKVSGCRNADEWKARWESEGGGREVEVE